MTEAGTKAQRHRGTKGWRGWIARVGVCVAAGGVLTTLTAAASLLYAPTTMTDGTGGISSRDAEGQAPGTVLFKPGQVYEGVGIRETTDYWVWIAGDNFPGTPSRASGAGVPTVNVGWPLLAFTSPPVQFAAAGSYPEFQAATDHAYARTATTAAPEFLRAQPHRVVPGRILPVGFAVNMVLYAAFAGAVLFAPGAIRRGLRRRGGRCVGCGYPLTGGERCPECGDAAPQGGKRRGRRGRVGRRWFFGPPCTIGDPAREFGGTDARADEHRPLKAAVGGTDLPFAICPFAIWGATP